MFWQYWGHPGVHYAAGNFGTQVAFVSRQALTLTAVSTCASAKSALDNDCEVVLIPPGTESQLDWLASAL